MEIVTKPISFRGLGVREAHATNIALLGKLLNELWTPLSKLWLEVLKSNCHEQWRLHTVKNCL